MPDGSDLRVGKTPTVPPPCRARCLTCGLFTRKIDRSPLPKAKVRRVLSYAEWETRRAQIAIINQDYRVLTRLKRRPKENTNVS